jgi:hypothetical protein
MKNKVIHMIRFFRPGFFLILPAFAMVFSCNPVDEQPDTDKPAVEIAISQGRQDSIWAETAGISYQKMREAVEFRSTLKNSEGYRAGIYIYDLRSIDTYIDDPKKLVARLALFGFNDLYLSVSKNAISGADDRKYQWIKSFNKSAHQLKMTVWALRFAFNEAFVNDDLIVEECAKILEFNRNVETDERFDAVMADWEPHVLKENGADTPSNLNYFWDSNKNYGIGKSNDRLLKRTLDMLTLAKENLNGLALSEAIHYMYQNNCDAGLLSFGSTLQFLNPCVFVSVMCYTDVKEAVWHKALAPVQNASARNKSVSVCIKTSINTHGDEGNLSTSLYPKGWNYLLETVDYLYTQGATEPAFRGVDFFEYEGLETMWNDHNP